MSRLRTVIAAGLLLVGTAWGQARQSVPIDLPAQPLSEALRGLSRQTGVQLVFPPALVAGKTAPAVQGTLSPEEALQQILAGSQLEAVPNGTGGYNLQRISTASASAPSPAGAIPLPEVEVTATTTRETATGPVTGYVARRSATGTKTDTPLIETPQSISVVTGDQMQAQAAASVPQALRYTSGVVAEQRGITEGGLERLFGRGFELEQYLDGLKLPPVTLRFGVPAFDTYALERIEVLHGPASVLYGQGFPGGIVNLTSKRPTVEPLREIQLQVGSYSRIQGAFDFSGPVDRDGHFLYRVTGLGRLTDTQIEPVEEEERIYIAPVLTWRPSNNTSLTILGKYQRDPKAGFYNLIPPEALFNNPNGTLSPDFNPGDPIFDRHDRTTFAIGYILDHRFDNTFSVHQNLRFTRTDSFIRGFFSDVLQEDGRTLNRFAFFQDERIDVFTIDNQAQAKFRTGPVAHTAILGVDYQWIDYHDTGAFDFSPDVPAIDIFNPMYDQSFPMPSPTIREHFVSKQVGLYVQDQIKFGPLSLLAGVRHDWAWSDDEDRIDGTTASQSDHDFTGRVGLTYLFDFGLAPYFSFATSFRPTGDVDFFGNPFKPTTGRQYELGLKYQPKGFNAFVTVAFFELRQNNVLTPDPDHTMFSIQTGQVRSRGIELEGHASLARGLDLVAAYTYLDQTVTKSNDVDLGKRLPGMPINTASLWLDYTIREGDVRGLGFGGGVRYVGSTYGDVVNSFKVPDYTVFDTAVHYNISSSNFRD